MPTETPFVEGFECHTFSGRGRYQPVLQWLLDHAGVGADSTVIDLGCGAGALVEAVLARAGDAAGLRVIGVDPSGPELAIARERVSDPRVSFVQARAQEAVGRVPVADVVVMSNVLHLIPADERPELFRAVHALLGEGGRFVLNTPFYDGAIRPETRWFYVRWMMKTREHLERAGVPAPRPDLGAPARQTWTPETHRRLLHEAGFSSVETDELIFDWTADDWAALCHYSLFIRGALGDVDLACGQQALIEAVRATFRDLDLATVPRAWLHVAATR